MAARPIIRLRLYIAGDAPNSLRAVANLQALCRAHLPDNHHLEIIDVLESPLRALEDSIFLTPTLVKLGPGPMRRIVGSLSQPRTVLEAFGLEEIAA